MSDEPYKVQVTLKHPKASVSKVHLAAGHETPEHSHKHDYVVHPRAATKLVRTSLKDGKVVKTEHIEHKPDEPYFVGASEDGVSFTIKNVGDGPMMCDKTLIPPRP